MVSEKYRHIIRASGTWVIVPFMATAIIHTLALMVLLVSDSSPLEDPVSFNDKVFNGMFYIIVVSVYSALHGVVVGLVVFIVMAIVGDAPKSSRWQLLTKRFSYESAAGSFGFLLIATAFIMMVFIVMVYMFEAIATMIGSLLMGIPSQWTFASFTVDLATQGAEDWLNLYTSLYLVGGVAVMIVYLLVASIVQRPPENAHSSFDNQSTN